MLFCFFFFLLIRIVQANESFVDGDNTKQFLNTTFFEHLNF